jgi:hypothetical protein
MEKSSSAASEADADAPSHFFMLRRPEFKFSQLPRDVIDEIDERVIHARGVEFCDNLSSVVPKSDMPYEEFIDKYSEFERRVQSFIRRIKNRDESHNPAHGDVDPTQPDACWFHVEIMCLSVLKEILLHYNPSHMSRDKLTELEVKIDWLRDIVMRYFAQNRMNIMDKMFEGGLNDAKVSIFLNSINWEVTICFCILKANMDALSVKGFERHALRLLEQYSEIFLTILQNEDISRELKKKTLSEFYNMMTLMYSLFEDGVRSQVQLSTQAKYNEINRKYKAILVELAGKYPGFLRPDPERQGGNSQRQSKNKSKRRNNKNKNSRHKKNKNRKKTLRLRIKK